MKLDPKIEKILRRTYSELCRVAGVGAGVVIEVHSATRPNMDGGLVAGPLDAIETALLNMLRELPELTAARVLHQFIGEKAEGEASAGQASNRTQ